MRKIWILARSGIFKNTYSSIIYVILSIILAFLCTTIFSFENNFNILFDSTFKETNSADCAEVIPAYYYETEGYNIRRILNEDTDVSTYQVEDTLLLLKTSLIHENQDKQLAGSWIIRNLERNVSLSTTKFVEVSTEKYDNPIYIPFICKSFFGFKLGDEISFERNNQAMTYHIAGFTESILFGNKGTIAFELPNKAFEAMKESFVREDEKSKIILIKSNNLLIHKKLLSLFKKIPYLNYVDRVSATLAMKASINIYKYIMIFFTIINIIIVTLVIRYRIKSDIIRGYKNIGILKALGYKSNEIGLSYVVQYLFLSILGYVIGVVLSAELFNSSFQSMAAETGLQWRNNTDATMIISMLLISICVVGFLTFLSTIKTRKISPVKVLRGVLVESRTETKVSVTRGILYPKFIISWKLFYNRKNQNVMLIMIISLAILATSFFLTLYTNIVDGQRLGLQQISGMEKFSIILQLKDEENVDQWVEKIKTIDGVKQIVRSIGPGGSVLSCDGKSNAKTTVYDDYEKIDKVGLYKGRYPWHENEVAISARLASILKKGEGDFITIRNEFQETSNACEYLITGITQGSYTGGMDISLTFDGLKQIDESARWQMVYIYALEGENIDYIIDDIKQICGDSIAYVDNFQNVFNKQFESVTKNISNLVLLVLILSMSIVSVIVFLLAQTIVLNNIYMFGILKAIGFTTMQIIHQVVASIFPIVILGSFVGYVLSKFLTNRIIILMLNKMGVCNVSFSLPNKYILGFVALLSIISYIVAMLTLWKLKYETPIRVIRQKE